MKRLFLLIVLFTSCMGVQAQTLVNGYEYWFNDDFASRVTSQVSPSSTYVYNQNVSTAGLSVGMNTFNFRSFDTSGKYSSVVSHFFYKASLPESMANPKIVEYQYWLDTNFTSAVTVSTTAQQQVNVSSLVPMSSLAEGVHSFNIRFADSVGVWSSVVSHFFYKASLPESIANPKIVEYQYWLDTNFASAVTVSTSSQQQVNVSSLVPMSSLADGVHSFNVRFADSVGVWSSVVSHFFYKASLPESIANPKIVEYQYWLDTNFASAVTVSTTSQQQVNVSSLVPMSSLADGVHSFNVRFADSVGVWSSVVSHFFYKASLPESIANPKIVEYQYWLDTNFTSAVTVSTTAQQQVNVSSLVPMSSLADGVHSFNIRFADSVGVWSSLVSSFFYKIPQQTIVQNDIIEYRYWVDTSFSNAVTLPVSPNQQVNVMDDLDLTQIPKGEHLIHFQFRDTLDLWSVVITDTVQKISLPVANFDYVVMPDCDSTVVQFTDSSIDGDIYLWDFGDGSTDTVANPSHTFYAPGNYVITQTITDTLTLADSTYQISLNVTGNTFGSVSETVCDSYTSPSGNYSFTQSGTFADTILNSMGCDSILTIQLTVLNSTTYTDMISSCESYTWIDGNTYTASTNAPTVTLVNAAGCDSVVTLDLTILQPTAYTDVISSCVSYTWIDGNTYTTSTNTPTVTLVNAVGCDSVVTLDLTILQPTAYTDVISSCASYTWIDGNTYTTSTNAPTVTLVNAAGCDSVVTLDLTILTVDTSVIQSGNTLEAIATNASFQWLDCGDNYALIAGANSSVFIPEKSGNYAVEVSQNTCVDTSSCFTVSNVSIVEQTFSTEISAFPNPTDGHFTIDLGNMYSKVEITIYDINSRIVYRNIYAQADIIQLQLTEPAGLYMVAIRSENQSAIIRLVKR